jgi:hypothetical protein
LVKIGEKMAKEKRLGSLLILAPGVSVPSRRADKARLDNRDHCFGYELPKPRKLPGK